MMISFQISLKISLKVSLKISLKIQWMKQMKQCFKIQLINYLLQHLPNFIRKAYELKQVKLFVK